MKLTSLHGWGRLVDSAGADTINWNDNIAICRLVSLLVHKMNKTPAQAFQEIGRDNIQTDTENASQKNWKYKTRFSTENFFFRLRTALRKF